MFLEVWHDPATLSRVYVVPRRAVRRDIRFGKEVKICTPKQALDSFRNRAEDNSAQTIKDIDKTIERIHIEHASATFDRDRRLVFGNIDESWPRTRRFAFGMW